MRRRGFTIVEMMVVISIIGLLSAALVVFLLGSEDRRCRLEAERLAAYLQTASAEAVMRDGPLRVVVDLDEQKCTREISEVGADIRAPLWRVDERDGGFVTRKPIRVSRLESGPANRSDGIGWIVFTRGQNRSAVLVVTLEESSYSVIVPGGDQPVQVQRGQLGAPEPPVAPTFPQRDRPPLIGLDDLPTPGQGGSLPSLGAAVGPPPERPDRPASKKNQPPPPNTDPGDLVPEEGFNPADVVPPPPAPAPPEPAPEPEPEPLEGPDLEPAPEPPLEPEVEGTCTSADQCEGRWSYCHRPVADQPGTCGRYPRGAAFYVRSVRVTQPEAVATFMTERIQDQVNAGLFTLYLAFSASPSEHQRPPDAPRTFYLAQTTYDGAVHRISDVLPAIRLPNAGWLGGLNWAVRAQTENTFGREFSLYLVNLESGVACPYAPITVVANVVATVNASTTPATASVRITGALRPEHARLFRVPIAGDVRGLDQVLRDANVHPQVDSNNDNVPDAWGFQFVGRAVEADLIGDPALAVGNDPCN